MKPSEPITRPVPDWALYELRKAQWCEKHQDATPEEYQQAMRRIARECGV